MPDTPRSLSYLTGTAFVGGTPNSISSQSVRDFVVSIGGGGLVTPTGASTARTLASRFSDVAYAEDFGAVGDGTTDNKTFIQNALDSLTSVVTLTKPGTYMVSGAIDMSHANQQLVLGSGVILQLTAGAHNGDIIDLSSSNIALIGGTLDGNVSNVTGQNAQIGCVWTPWTGVLHSNQLVDGVTVRNCGGIGIGGDCDVTDLTIRNCRVTNCTGACILLDADSFVPARIRIYDNIVDNTANASGSNGIYVVVYNDLLITRNRVLLQAGSAGICIEAGRGSTPTSTYGTFSNNITEGGDMGLSLAGGTGVVIDGNRVYNAATYGIEIPTTFHAICSGNVVEGANSTDIGIAVDGVTPFSSHIEIVGNTITDATSSGVQLHNCSHIAAVGNNILRTTAPSGGYDGFDIQGSSASATDWVLNGGVIDCFTTTGTTGLSFLNGWSEGSVSDMVIMNAATGIALSASTAVTCDNVAISGIVFKTVTTPIQAYASGNFTGSSSAGSHIRVTGCTGLAANGNAYGYDMLDWKNNVCVFVGAGSPSSSVTAGPGSTYLNQSGGTGATFWVKESGTGNTVWVAK